MALQDLNQRFPIVDPRTGMASDYFMRVLLDRNRSAGDVQEEVDGLRARQIIAGDGLTGGGTLDADVTLNADEQAILDAISSTRGTILYRGASDWAALAPGTSGHYLKTNGAGADPAWAAVAGGSFSGARLYVAGTFTPVANAETVISAWDTADFNTGPWWTSGSNFVVPSGVSYIEASNYLRRTGSFAGQFIAAINVYTSGDVFLGQIARQETDTAGGDAAQCSTGPFAVSAGMILKAVYFVADAGNLDNGKYGCNFSIKALG